jgi:hypothetical protein
MTERIKAWACIGCGRIQSDETCIGVCQDRKVELVNAADYEELRQFVRQLALISPRNGEWERSYRGLQQRARAILEHLGELESRKTAENLI